VGRVAALAVLGCLGLGLALGVAWAVLAPRVPLVVAGGTAVPDEYQPGGYIADDGVYALLAVVAGLLVAAVVQSVARRPLLTLVTGVIGGLVGATAMWWVGTRLGRVDVATTVASSADGAVFDAPLELRMPGLLLLWPAAAAALATSAALVAWWSGRRGREPSPPG
jgi:hypothetical protein